jgi:hypothetical protein
MIRPDKQKADKGTFKLAFLWTKIRGAYTMEKKENKNQKNKMKRWPLKLRALSIMLAVTMLFSLSGVQVMASGLDAGTETAQEAVQETPVEQAEIVTDESSSEEAGGYFPQRQI